MIHPFELAGFGIGPYRCVGYKSITYQACKDAPVQVGGSCDYCSTGIIHHYFIRSFDGIEFKVGCDCVRKVDKNLVKELATVKREYIRKARLAAIEQAERAEHGGLTRSELWARERALRAAIYQAERDMREAKRLASVYVGDIGKRQFFSLTLTGWHIMESYYGIIKLYFFEDNDGNQLVWKASGRLVKRDSHGDYIKVNRGDQFILKATVKSHTEYKGAKQTVLTRAVQQDS